MRLAHELRLPSRSWGLRLRQRGACGQLQCVEYEVVRRVDLCALGAEHQLAPDRGPILPAWAPLPK